MALSIKRSKVVLLALLLFLLSSSAIQGAEGTNVLLQNREKEYAASKLLDRAKELISKGQYDQALQDLIAITDYYTEFSRIDETFVVIGNCMTDMELYSGAENIFKHMIRNYTDSPWVPHALFGLERLNYLQGNYQTAIDYFRFIRERFPDAPLGEGIYYYGGQSFLYLNQFDKAITTFSAIDEKSEYWGFALYSRAQAYLKKKI